MRKAFSYLRVSGGSQINQGGFPRQRETVLRYAKASRVELVDEFLDGGVKGTTAGDDRPGLAELMYQLAADGVSLVLVERADRLSRDLMVGELILKSFRDLGVQVVAADSGTDLTVSDAEPSRVLIRQMMGAVAQYDKTLLVSRMRAGKLRKNKALGRSCEGVKPFGALPGEDETLKRLKELARKLPGKKRLGSYKIANILNDEGRATRSGKQWHGVTVRQILERGSK